MTSAHFAFTYLNVQHKHCWSCCSKYCQAKTRRKYKTDWTASDWWFCCCWLFLLLFPLWESVIVLYFVVRYFMSILVLQSSWWGRESWLLCLICHPGVSWWLSGSSSRCHGVVCSLWLWYFLIILTYYLYQRIEMAILASYVVQTHAL